MSCALTWLKDYKKEAAAGEKLLGMDNLKAQCHPDFKEFAFKKTKSLIIYTPPDCTDLCAVTDAGLGKLVKMQMRKLFDAHQEANPDLWLTAKGLSAAQRRELFCKWLSETWTWVKAEKREQITKAFQSCGMLNSLDGREDNLIKIQGYDGPYSLNDAEEEEVDAESDDEEGDPADADEIPFESDPETDPEDYEF